MKPYLYYEGLLNLSKELTGKENIYLGIRPYGFHAGNMSTLVVYPILLCKQLQKLGKTPSFKIFVFINDWEQNKLDGPDPKKYPYNTYPLDTTFQYTFDPQLPTKNKNVVNYWEPVIAENVMTLKRLYPKVTIKVIRNSQMKNDLRMKKCVLVTIKKPIILANILKKYGNKPLLEKPLVYSLAVCPSCHFAKGKTKVINRDIIVHHCEKCGKESTNNYKLFDYWLYHKPLALPRLEICKIDICITGADHYTEGDFLIRKALIKAYGAEVKTPKTLYAPIVLGSNGLPMGKSKGNAVTLPLEKLIDLNLINQNAKEIKIDKI